MPEPKEIEGGTCGIFVVFPPLEQMRNTFLFVTHDAHRPTLLSSYKNADSRLLVIRHHGNRMAHAKSLYSHDLTNLVTK